MYYIAGQMSALERFKEKEQKAEPPKQEQEPDKLYIEAYNYRLLRATRHCRKLLAQLILVHVFKYDVTRIHVEVGIHLQGGEVDDVATLVSGVVIPSVCIGINHAQLAGRVLSLRQDCTDCQCQRTVHFRERCSDIPYNLWCRCQIHNRIAYAIHKE